VVLVVEKEDSRARFLYLEKMEGQFEVIYTTLAWIGSNGLGKTMEGDCKTPAGVYTLSHPFGRNDDPGCQIPYVKLDDSWYWVEDGNSQYYNQMVTTNEVEMDWTEAEQLNKFGYSYNYSIAIDFNKDRVPGMGSAIFLHCTHNSPTRGCVAIEEELMVGILQRVQEGAMIALYPDEDSIK
jgi:L,D-peptidoglycan transpeptidase YkuD (ErfK/YbiS/YcfS/YnhG family)